MTISDEESAFVAIGKLHELGPETVIISSTQFHPTDIMVYGSKKTGADYTKIKMQCPRIGLISDYFTGTGDLLTAMTLAQLDKHPSDFAKAMEIAVNIVRAVLRKTVEQPI